MTATASYVKARAEVRLTTARTDYRYFRGRWAHYHHLGQRIRFLREALVARERWNTLTELLSDPDWSSLRANGLDADDLALMAADHDLDADDLAQLTRDGAA